MDLKYKNNQNFKIILKHYKFTQEDALNLFAIRDIAIKNSDILLKGFYEFIFEFDHAKMFLHNKDIIKRHQEGIKQWFINLFCGEYDEIYFAKLNIISEVHVNIGLPAHYVNTAFSYVRDFIKGVLIKQKYYDSLRAVDKIIDINLDILTIAYREEEQTKLVEDIVLLKNSVENSDIEPYVQGIFDTKTLKLSKYECLMRLIDRKNNKVHSVFTYLNTSKKIKIYKDMMQIMIEKSINMFCGRGIEFSINLSYEDIENEVFRDYIYKKIENCPSSKNIIFEILESDFIEDFTIVESFASKVRESGCKIAIDDFGSGFSSMENILNLKPDIIKIDGSLIKNIDTSMQSRTIVKNIVNMAKDLNAKTVAEYVHSKEVLEIVQALEVDYAQGFYLAEPKVYDNLEY